MAQTSVQVQASIATLETALARGELRVDFADRSVTYRSVDELEKSLVYFKGLLSELNGGRPRQSVAVASTGFHR